MRWRAAQGLLHPLHVRAHATHCVGLLLSAYTRLRRRLETILDSDRILALDDGHVAEFDTPQALLSNPDSLLTGLVEAAGPEVAAKLRAIAAGGPARASAAVAAVVHAGVPPTVPEV